MSNLVLDNFCTWNKKHCGVRSFSGLFVSLFIPHIKSTRYATVTDDRHHSNSQRISETDIYKKKCNLFIDHSDTIFVKKNNAIDPTTEDYYNAETKENVILLRMFVFSIYSFKKSVSFKVEILA